MKCIETIVGRRVLVVEDDYYLASDLAARLTALGVRVIGPYPSVSAALEQVETSCELDGAILDINLGGEMVFPLADELERRRIWFVFATGYDPEVVPARHMEKLILRKPLDEETLVAALSDTARPRSVSVETARANQILAALPRHRLGALLPFFRQVRLPRGAVLENAGQTVCTVYFPIDCVTSLIAVGSKGTRIETGMIGREGMTGTGFVVGDIVTPYELVNQIDGYALSIPVEHLRSASIKLPQFHLLACLFTRSLAVQVSFSAFANGAFDIRTRLARWLLMVHDRTGQESFDLTHDYLAIMLGVRRSSVTDAIHILEGEHLIRATRSNIEIGERSRLVEFAGESYGMPESEHERLMALGRSKLETFNLPVAAS